MSTDDLAAFLADRYDEAEALAKAAPVDPVGAIEAHFETHAIREQQEWDLRPERKTDYSRGQADALQWAAGEVRERTRVVLHAPAHRLADIKLKRAILAEHATETSRVQVRALPEDIAEGKPLWWYEDERQCVICGWFDGEHGGCATVRQLGTEFDEHPGYKEGWKP